MTGASRQSRATLKLRLFSSRHPALDQRRDARVGEIRDRQEGADFDQPRGVERGRQPDDGEPGRRRRAHAGKRILEGDGFFRARPGSLERGQVGQRIGLGARQLAAGEVRACVIPVDLAINHIMIDEMSEPVARAFLDGLALCEREDIPNLWVRDPHGLFPPRDRPVRQVR